MVLSPSDDPEYHSIITWWRGKDALITDFGGQFRWRNFPDTTITNWPSSQFSALTLNFPGKDVFCAGHTHMADGKVFVTGGTELDGFEVGTTHTLILDPQTRTWDSTSVPAMSARRWYPTATPLGDGRIVVSSGSQYFHAYVFGGITGTNTLPTDSTLYRRKLTSFGGSDVSIVNTGGPGNPNWPRATTGMSVLSSTGYGARVFTGGLVSPDSVTRGIWMLYRDDNTMGGDYTYTWIDRSAPGQASGQMLLRMEHVSAAFRDTVLVWGGRDKTALLSPAALQVFRPRPSGQSPRFEWLPVTATGTPPAARHGMMAATDTDNRRMYITGGATSLGGLPSDASVYQLSYDGSTNTAAWSTVPLTSTSPVPRARRGHVFVMDPNPRKYDANNSARRAILFGGIDPTGSYPDTVWILWFKGAQAEWQPVVPGDSIDIGREKLGYAYDAFTSRLYIYGGEANGQRKQDVRWVRLDALWENRPAWQALDDLVSPVSGHVAAFEPAVAFARVPEVFDANASPKWRTLSPFVEDWYPFTFLVPDSLSATPKLFVAGPDKQSYWLRPDASSSHATPVGAPGWRRYGSAVMYRTGRIMKCGTRDTDGFRNLATDTTQIIDVTGANPQWTTVGPMQFTRVNHNLTLLPTGEVLVTGGTSQVDNTQDIDPRYQPEIWNPATGNWYGGALPDLLHTDHHNRGYHSSSLLLPDGRVLCGGGNARPEGPHYHDRNSFNIFTPPYLFDANGQLKTRPVILNAPTTAMPGDPIEVSSDVSIDQVVLMRAGAVTHGYDSDQRYVPLNLVSTCSGGTGVVARVPADPEAVPPGDYMLFVLHDQTPAIARWLRIRDTAGSDPKAPQRISDLYVDCPLASDFRLSWTAPYEDYDNGASGASTAYELRYSTSAIDTCTLANTIVAQTATPSAPGTLEFGGGAVEAGVRCYFRIRSRDERSPNSNWSPWGPQLSTIPRASGVECESGLYGGSGDGGGSYRAAEATSMLPGGTPAGGDGAALLEGAAAGVATQDLLRLPVVSLDAQGVARVWLEPRGAAAADVSALALVAVDHASADEVVTAGGSFMAGVVSPATTAIRRRAGASEALTLADPVACEAGDTLDVELPAAATGALLVRGRAPAGLVSGEVGFDVMQRDANGGWALLGHRTLRSRSGDAVVAGLGAGSVRLVFGSDHLITTIGRLAEGATPGVQAIAPAMAQHPALGDVTATLAASQTVTLTPGERLTATFDAPAASEGLARDWYLRVTALRLSSVEATARRGVPSAEPGAPLRFELAGNRPNPFRGGTTFRFAVPKAADVRLDLFDLQGRRVTTLAHQRFDAGWHDVEWSRTRSDGTPVHAGIYLVRMTAPGFRAERKLTVFP